MDKVLLIIKREYFSRVKKKSFLIMTFLVPILIIGMYAAIIALTVKGGDKKAAISIIDDSGVFYSGFKDTKSIDFDINKQSLATAKEELVKEKKENFILYVPANIREGGKIEMFSRKRAGFSVMGEIEGQVNDMLRTKMLKDAGIDAQTIDNIKPNISIVSKEITDEGEKDSSAGAAYAVGFAAAILIYMSLFIYGAQVMRGVIEEKTNRIIEVVVSSVKPFQLMFGKIIGIGLVGLTQFMLWIILSATLMTIAGQVFMKDQMKNIQTEQMNAKTMQADTQNPSGGPAMDIVKALQTVNFSYILTVFIIYFLGGYMLYSALFAAVGSAVDNETETQQFMFPITLPLLFTYILSFSFIVNNPDSSLSFWLSIIPFTSPIAMMVRLPFGVPDWQVYISVTLLVLGFIATTWIAARIYRVGILMYGKKTSYKELAKWFMYKE